VPEGGCEPALAGAGGAGDDDRDTVPDVVAGGQVEITRIAQIFAYGL